MSKPITFAVIGGGAVGTGALRAASRLPGVECVGVCDTNPDSRTRLTDEFGIPACADVETLLELGPDAIKVASPNALHADHAVAALEAGCHVLTEKPMATTMADCQRMLRAAEASGKLLMVNFEYRVSTLFAKVHELIAAGHVGQPRNVMIYESRGPFMGQAGGWRFRAGAAGGLITEKLVHYIDLCCWFVGQPATSVHGFHGPNTIKHYEFPDNAFLVFKHGGTAQSVVATHHGIQPDMFTGTYPPGDPDFQRRSLPVMARYGHRDFTLVAGDEGSIIADVQRMEVATSRYQPCEGRGGQRTWPDAVYDFNHVSWSEACHNQVGLLEHFIACVRGEAEPAIPVAESCRNMAAVFAAEDALAGETGVTIESP